VVTSLRIAGRPYVVWRRKAKAMGDAAGLHWGAKSRIDILAGQTPVEEADTLLHEVMHAILYCQGREYGGEVEETYVRALATGLIGVLQDNPEFASWLSSTHTPPCSLPKTTP